MDGRSARLLRIAMVLAAVLIGGNFAVSGVNWNRIWRGLDQTHYSVVAIEPSPDYERINVTLEFDNRSNEEMVLVETETWLRLDGRAISAGRERFASTALPSHDRQTIQVSNTVQSIEQDYVRSKLENGDPSWVVGGQFRLGVATLTEPVWYPFAVRVE